MRGRRRGERKKDIWEEKADVVQEKQEKREKDGGGKDRGKQRKGRTEEGKLNLYLEDKEDGIWHGGSPLEFQHPRS